MLVVILAVAVTIIALKGLEKTLKKDARQTNKQIQDLNERIEDLEYEKSKRD